MRGEYHKRCHFVYCRTRHDPDEAPGSRGQQQSRQYDTVILAWDVRSNVVSRRSFRASLSLVSVL